jgi:hypothetical protein
MRSPGGVGSGAGEREVRRGSFEARRAADCLPPGPDGYRSVVSFGTSIFLIAVGAILRYTVTATGSGIALTTVGLILMILGIVLSLFYMLA